MKFFFKFISYIFHPLFFPLMGTLIYYQISPKFHPDEEIQSIVLRISILTLLIPIIFFYLLKNIGWIQSVYLTRVSERKIPLYIYIFLNFMVIYGVISPVFSIELYYYFAGIIASLFACLIFVFFKFKASMHMMAIAGILLFLIGLSFHYEKNIVILISAVILLTGIIASSRLYLKAHTVRELFLGFLIGSLPQFFAFNYWL